MRLVFDTPADLCRLLIGYWRFGSLPKDRVLVLVRGTETMHAFFKSWRRKVGCVVLAMALALTAGWVRSLLVFDSVRIRPVASTTLRVESKRQLLCVSWAQDRLGSTNTLPFWNWLALDPSLRGTELPDDYKVGAFACLVNLSDEYPLAVILEAPYWSVTLPLTLLSAYLILRKPRTKSRSPNQPDSTGTSA